LCKTKQNNGGESQQMATANTGERCL